MSSVLRELLRPPRRGRVVLVIIVAAVAAAVLWYFGLDVLRSIIAGLALATIGVSWVAIPDHDDSTWAKDAVLAQDGARREVAQLSWSLHTRRGRVRHGALGRAQGLARRRLALHQLELGDPNDRPAIEQLLGSAVYSTLQPKPEQAPPRPRDLVRCLDALEALDRLVSDQHRPRPRHLPKEQQSA